MQIQLENDETSEWFRPVQRNPRLNKIQYCFEQEHTKKPTTVLVSEIRLVNTNRRKLLQQ